MASSVFWCLILTDMELVALLPWKTSADLAANGFPIEAAKRGRFNSHVEDGVQVTIQIVYLVLLGQMDWETLPSMVLSAAAFIFRVFVNHDQSKMQDQTNRGTYKHASVVITHALHNFNVAPYIDAALRCRVEAGNRKHRTAELLLA